MESRNIEIIRLTYVENGFDEEFSPGKRLMYSQLNGEVLIILREYNSISERNNDVSFTPERLRALQNRIHIIDRTLRHQKLNVTHSLEIKPLYRDHLGAGVHVSISNKYHGIDLRHFWIPPDQFSIQPTTNGIFLSISQWSAFKQKLNELLNAYPELIQSQECYHELYIETLDCRECLPFWQYK